MKCDIVIPCLGVDHLYRLLPGQSSFQIISLPGVIHLEIRKSHNHSYSFSAFLYARKRIVDRHYYTSKKDLYGAIQNLIYDELYHV